MTRYELSSGGSLELLELSGEHGVVSSSSAFPPGSTLEFRVAPAHDAVEPSARDAQVFQLKVRSCRRSAADRFQIEGRFVNLSRAARELLAGSS